MALAGRTHTRLVNSLKTANRELADLTRYENEHTRDVAKAALAARRADVAEGLLAEAGRVLFFRQELAKALKKAKKAGKKK